MYYVCIIDQGGRNGTASDMGYHLPQQHLIRAKQRVTKHELDQILKAIAKTRKSPKIIGVWGPDEDGLSSVLEYEKL